jgi:serine/threonine-protein kinase
VETRSSAIEPHAPGSPNATDVSVVTHDAPTPGITRLMPVDELPLSAEDCALGEVVAGKYLIEGVIGRGSMGVVVRATHLGFDELVALKFIRPEMRKVDGIVSRFAREAKASVRIRNEHAVNVLDVGVADPIGPFFVMEYLEGINLEELVDSQGAFDAATAVKYVLEACEALAAAHAQGIIHRDIKPQNLFLAWQGRLELIKVLDFGISKAALSGQVFGDDLSSTETDWVMGTPLYMSPEQLRHAPDIDERTDIWSLGAVLYELLYGQPLFSGDTQTQVCRQVLEVEHRPVRLPIPGVPEELWDVIERCLSLDKEQRYDNVAELGEALLPFAPAGAVLHVERARALLGLGPLDLFDPDDDIEDIDVDPIEEPEAPQLEPARPRPLMRSWVELAVPALACAVLWIGVRQCQLDERTAALSTDTQTQTLALRPAHPPSAPSAPAHDSAPVTTVPPSNEALATAPLLGPCLAAPAAPAQPATASPSATPAPVTPADVAPPASGAPVATTPVAPGVNAPVATAPAAPVANAPVASAPPASPQPAPAPASSSATAATARAAAAAAPSPVSSALLVEDREPSFEREDAPATNVEPKLEFRLIDDDTPRAATDLAPSAATARAAAPSPPPR